MSLRLSIKLCLSLMSLLCIHVLIWSRRRWSFLIWDLRSTSSFSFCVWFVLVWILSKIWRARGSAAFGVTRGGAHRLEDLDLAERAGQRSTGQQASGAGGTHAFADLLEGALNLGCSRQHRTGSGRDDPLWSLRAAILTTWWRKRGNAAQLRPRRVALRDADLRDRYDRRALAPLTSAEHMESDEADGTFPPWVSLEYTQMLKLAFPSPVIFSSLSAPSVSSLRRLLTSPDDENRSSFTTSTSSVGELMAAQGIPLERVCLLDPKAEQEISPEDSELFDWFLFGGILGDDPPRGAYTAPAPSQLMCYHRPYVRAQESGFPDSTSPRNADDHRHRIGCHQAMCARSQYVHSSHPSSTDSTVPLDKIPFIDNPTFQFDEIESVEMPFRYVMDAQGEAILPVGMRQLLQDDMEKAFDD